MADAPVFGRTVLVAGPESFLVDQAVSAWRQQVVAEAAGVEIRDVQAADLTAADLAEMTSGSLFSAEAAVIIHDLSQLPAEMVDHVVSLASDTPGDVAVMCTFPGGQKGSGTITKLKKAKIQVIDAAKLKSNELEGFVVGHARRMGVRIDQPTAHALVDGVGTDLRSLAGALAQLIADAGDDRVDADLVKRYFSGRAEVTGFKVADDVMDGETSGALERLRWALETGTAPVLLISAIANNLRAQGLYQGARSSGMNGPSLASACGVPPWKLKDLEKRARRWDATRIADGLIAVSRADADIKGRAGSPAFTLERLVLELTT